MTKYIFVTGGVVSGLKGYYRSKSWTASETKGLKGMQLKSWTHM